MKINRNTWHFKLASFADPSLFSRNHVSICEYVRRIVASGFSILLVICMLGIMLYSFGIMVYDLYNWLLYSIPMSSTSIGFAIIFGIVFIGIVIMYMNTTDNIVSTWVRAKKEKFCPIVKIED